MKIGFIGIGNMATAIIAGMRAGGAFENDTLCGFNRSGEKTADAAKRFGIEPCSSVFDTAAACDVVVLCVKPQMLPDVLPDVRRAMDGEKLVVSIAAGKTLAYFADELGENVPVIRVMPNMNAAVGASVSGICPNSRATQEHIRLVRAMFNSVGSVMMLPENMFSAFTAVAGSSPAFTYIYIDALASAAVKAGMPKPMAIDAAAAAVMGSAKMLMESSQHPRAMADKVCSPGGTTIEGVLSLEESGFAGAVEKAVTAVIEKDHSLG